MAVTQGKPSGGGPFFGATPPAYITGNRYPSPYVYSPDTTTLTTTATRLYYVLTYVWEARSFQGCATHNSGAGDNGDTYRTGIYTHSATNGPTTLLHQFGEVTLTGAASERLQSSSFSVTTPGFYWLAFHANQAAAMARQRATTYQESGAGYGPPVWTPAFAGFVASPWAQVTTMGIIRSVDTAYGSLASTAVAPTTDQDFGPLISLRP